MLLAGVDDGLELRAGELPILYDGLHLGMQLVPDVRRRRAGQHCYGGLGVEVKEVGQSFSQSIHRSTHRWVNQPTNQPTIHKTTQKRTGGLHYLPRVGFPDRQLARFVVAEHLGDVLDLSLYNMRCVVGAD